ncbi:hypothetical protein BGZ95_005444 [Linnemannia exigua]|uniref:Cyclin-domain-containing protein n=1 Tax=Linnemannia exigua TaxID=604196 RepID=A0AAD4D1Y3_9FUNG|nr:hypothetical protein BGZ95_005444 [Linnemannia exigua]
MDPNGSTYSSMGHLPSGDPNAHANVNYSSAQYHSVSTTPVSLHNQHYQQQQQQQQQQQYLPIQTQGQSQPHLQHIVHQQHQHGQQQLQQQLQQPPSNIQHISHSNSYKQQAQPQSMAQPIYVQQTQQQLQHHLKAQQVQQQPVHQVQQRQQHSGPIVVTTHPTHQVLSATQLSSSVILLSLKYIQKLLKNNPSIHGQQGSEFRLFTVSLMLANKFLDDNTFTNKTWSDVTGINVKEINVMEMEFLNQVQFSLFVSEAEYLDWLHSLETWLKQQGQAQPQGSN